MSLTPEPAGVAQGAFFPAGKARRGPLVLLCHVMLRTDVFQIRIEPERRDRLARLRDERHVNPGAWARDVIAAALDRELPADLEAPKRQPLAGWKPCKLGDGWGVVLEGPGVAALAEDPRPAPISITDSRGGCWTATITEVVSRNRQRIVVRDSGRP